MMLLAVLSGFLLAVAVPALYRVAGKHIGWVLALLPALLTAYFVSLIPAVSGGETLLIRNQWMPGLGVSLDFMMPVGTPPNAIAYSTGLVRVKEMIKNGVLMNLGTGMILALMYYFFWT